MVTITHDSLTSILDDTTIAAATTEEIIDLAIDTLNLFGADLPNMSGVAGTKTLGLESKEKGAVLLVARKIYYGFYKGAVNVGIGGLSVTTPDVLGNASVLNFAKECAGQLLELDVTLG
jgi:hypothetical protein